MDPVLLLGPANRNFDDLKIFCMVALPVLECWDVDWSDCPHIEWEFEWVLW